MTTTTVYAIKDDETGINTQHIEHFSSDFNSDPKNLLALNAVSRVRIPDVILDRRLSQSSVF
jgi:hypothetical protein